MNTHSINDDEGDIAGLESSVSSINTSITNINNKLSNSASSALKTNIDSNSSSITTLNSQLSNSTSSTLKTNIDTNTNNISGIANNSTSSNLKSAVDTNTAGRSTNTNSINTLNAQMANTSSSGLKTFITAIDGTKLNNNADDTMAGDLTIYKASDDNNLNVLCDSDNRARINVCGIGTTQPNGDSMQGSGIVYVGQGQNTYGGYFCYLGDTTPAIDIGTSIGDLALKDYITFGTFNNGLSRPVFYYTNNISTSWASMYYLGPQFIYNSAPLYLNGGDIIYRTSSSSERARVHINTTIRGNAGGDVGWTPTGTGTGSKIMMENTSDEGGGICVSSDGACLWNPGNINSTLLNFVDEDLITSTSYSGYVCRILTNGTLQASSDERLKTHIKDLDFQRNILDIVDDIPVKTYFRKCNYDLSGNEERYEKNRHKYETLEIGTIAQKMPNELKKLLVSDDDGDFPNKHYSVCYDRMVMICIEAIKELKKEIEILKKK